MKIEKNYSGFSALNLDQETPSAKTTTEALSSGFKTPFIPTGKWADIKKVGQFYSNNLQRKSLGEKLLTNIFDEANRYYSSYPSWKQEEVPISEEDIEAIFLQLTEIFGFQFDSTRNMFDYFMRILDSRTSRASPEVALRSLHADYIGGVSSNFKKWYFAAQLDLDDSIGFANIGSKGKIKTLQSQDQSYYSLEEAEKRWCENMSNLSLTDCTIQVALYLLCWGEANNIRFMPELFCFIFKCCNDYYYSLDNEVTITNATPSFLDHTITPLYNFHRDQLYQKVHNQWERKNNDHTNTIGYDDMNQLFWNSDGLNRLIITETNMKLMHLPPGERYLQLVNVNWKKAFQKTFRESRSWSHVWANFNRIWVIHISTFWYYTIFNSPTLYTKNYKQEIDNKPTTQARLIFSSYAGILASFITLVSTILESYFVPRRWAESKPVLKRIFILTIIIVFNLGVSFFIISTHNLDKQTAIGLSISWIQFIFSVLLVLYLSIVPTRHLFNKKPKQGNRSFLANYYFLEYVYQLKGSDRLTSQGLWLVILLSKFLESYFFLTLSMKDSIRELNTLKQSKCAGDIWLGNWLCSSQANILLCLMNMADFILFFLDTYLWYIIWNTIFSVCRSFYIGVSIWTPWKNVFSKLPKRIQSKIISQSSTKYLNMDSLVSEIWNSIVISMYRDHFLSIEHVSLLIYQKNESLDTQMQNSIKEPSFFLVQDDQSVLSSLFQKNSEAQRRITFFAQSLSTPMPEVGSIESMPSFTVLIPHYGEKILLTLKEIIKEEEQYSHITMLEYLKSLHPEEWKNFVYDSKKLAEDFETDTSTPEVTEAKKFDDFSYYSVGYRIAAPEYTLRTRIWASLRSQTLYRTISGFMNYSRAIKLLYDVEHETSETYEDQYLKMEAASILALTKFRIVVSMQRLKNFSNEEKESTEFLLRAYPELQIAYLDEEYDSENDDKIYYAALIDGSCAVTENGERCPKYKIRLSGNPILGDGKSDNQNLALVFCRGEYIQLVDANQDNYLEECIKIRSVLQQFEETTLEKNPYHSNQINITQKHPVAIVGTREYILSENVGVLGDVAAGKEQTFGTLFARTLAQIGGKLHYGHPDFLNSIFMTTRGGVSKAQKGIHLNEDIYAGMNALSRGGRIKHCEYIQCGKGRDLGFGSILNFTTKIGAGMGEQILSREYFYLGSTLPIDRFLSFYYAHAGFHLNNLFIILSIKLLLLVAINIAVFTKESIICEYSKHVPITDTRKPMGCHNLVPVIQWLNRCIMSIFVVFAISFIPLCVQELTERGLYRAFTRLGKHLISLSPLFEVFVCKIYSHSISSNITIGGAKYIGTGRGFATIRIPFANLYSRFALESFYFGAYSLLLVLYCTLSMWRISFIYFWITITALLISPCLFNPNQFSWIAYFLDYGEYMKWLFRGNTKPKQCSWISYTRMSRSKLTGVKKTSKSKNLHTINDVKPSKLHLLTNHLICQIWNVIVVGCTYLFANSQYGIKGAYPSLAFARIVFIIFLPITMNSIVLLCIFPISCIIGPFGSLFYSGFPALFSFIAQLLSLINYLISLMLLWYLQNWDTSQFILGIATVVAAQTWLLKLGTIIFITREFNHDKSNQAWWSGKWITAGLGWYIFTQPIREFFCKIAELSYFPGDFMIGHAIYFCQLPIIIIPKIDVWHSSMLFWLKPKDQVRPQIINSQQKRVRRFKVAISLLLYFLILSLLIGILLTPIIIDAFDFDLDTIIPNFLQQLRQPYSAPNFHKGLRKNHN